MSRQYWIDLFTGKTWDEFLSAGGHVSGFRASKEKTLRRFKPGDWLLCYVTGVSRLIAVLEVEGQPFKDETAIWSDEPFPVRVAVRPITILSPETSIPVSHVIPLLSFYEESRPHAWTGRFRTSPAKLGAEDGAVIAESIAAAEKSPRVTPLDHRKWDKAPRLFESGDVVVTIPDDATEPEDGDSTPVRGEHEEIQNLLLQMGSTMGFDVWVARNDRSRIDAEPLGARLRSSLPTQFDEATTRTVEHIDVLWLKRNSIEAAFEIEHTTSIYSGLLRMSDLVAMQPNLTMRLFIVAPEDRRDRVLREIARPTFARLPRPLSDLCRYVSYASLRDSAERYAGVLPHLKADFLDEISEAVELR